MAGQVEIVEVSARDGIQNESRRFSVEEKIALIQAAVRAGARRIEVGSFVRADRVPQMADTETVLERLDLPAEVTTIGLVMNRKGLGRALGTSIREIGAICLASDSFAQRNQGQSSRESVETAAELVALAQSEGCRAQVTIGAAFGCPFEGEIGVGHVVEIARRLAEAGPREIALADTIGVAAPGQIATVVSAVRQALPDMPLRLHLHNTRGTGLANAWAGIEAGATTLDSSIGGIGGCPFAPRATGNIATEDLVYMLDRSGVETGYDLDAVIAAAEWLTTVMGRELPGLVSRAGSFPPATAQRPAGELID